MNNSNCINNRDMWTKTRGTYKKVKTDREIMDNLTSFLNFLKNFCHVNLRHTKNEVDYNGEGYGKGGLALLTSPVNK